MLFLLKFLFYSQSSAHFDKALGHKRVAANQAENISGKSKAIGSKLKIQVFMNLVREISDICTKKQPRSNSPLIL